jgi:hypothetical protein
MALLGKDLAVASVGISCQTSFQIEANQTLIRKLSGAALEHHATPFDSIYCSARSAAIMIHDGIYYPTDAGELTGNKKPFWTSRGVYFWHSKFDDFEKFTSRARHLDESWARIRDAQRRVFIISNNQNNITRSLIEADREPIECRLVWKDVFRLFGVLARRFGQVELHVVARPEGFEKLISTDVLMPWADGRIPITPHKIPKDASQWAGDVRNWAEIFKRIIP